MGGAKSTAHLLGLFGCFKKKLLLIHEKFFLVYTNKKKAVGICLFMLVKFSNGRNWRIFLNLLLYGLERSRTWKS
jgi:hypothetical protein